MGPGEAPTCPGRARGPRAHQDEPPPGRAPHAPGACEAGEGKEAEGAWRGGWGTGSARGNLSSEVTFSSCSVCRLRAQWTRWRERREGGRSATRSGARGATPIPCQGLSSLPCPAR